MFLADTLHVYDPPFSAWTDNMIYEVALLSPWTILPFWRKEYFTEIPDLTFRAMQSKTTRDPKVTFDAGTDIVGVSNNAKKNQSSVFLYCTVYLCSYAS